MTPANWRKIGRGLFESTDGYWRITNPDKLTTELRHRWLVAERRSGGPGWNMHDGDYATLHDACAYVEGITSTTGQDRDEHGSPRNSGEPAA